MLHTYPVVTQNHCLAMCVRNMNCKALHFRKYGGNCEILADPELCMAQDFTNGTLYMELTKCQLYVPRKSFQPSVGNWRWVSGTSNPVNAVPIGLIYVIRVFERGAYLPGWWTNGIGFCVARPYQTRIGCSNSSQGEFLIFPPVVMSGLISFQVNLCLNRL